ncbi:hypothetical protein PHYSODRAFT_310332 [Phytophthora sojae]|uniref:Uncharacterized protein n=1 Tax=Phytophthora sojae (strain P6497) TaxID=1094619 RepID=G4YNJ9_PHYSP|nr:hypothetical protein PHYSODRAFT_310332 [Phytophthora sojae]EGZ30398.1 hypothetical protein PHYSODRAFT_310332 [Phytophthora sojae]|eukprot:XP_009517673.1 hypothetical protein PHYSODRAFT_310332 [Phytophthora sojae]
MLRLVRRCPQPLRGLSRGFGAAPFQAPKNAAEERKKQIVYYDRINRKQLVVSQEGVDRTTRFLMDRGFTQLQALKAISLHVGIQWLRDLGLSHDKINVVIKRHPNILGIAIDKYEALADWYISKGVSKNKLPYVFNVFPQAVSYGIDTNLEPKVDFLKEIGCSDKQITSVLMMAPQIFSNSVEGLRAKTNYLMELGISRELLPCIVARVPQCLGMKSTRVKESVDALDEMFGAGAGIRALTWNCIIVMYNIDSMRASLDYLISLGFTRERIEKNTSSSIVLKDKLTLEHVAVDISTDRVQYHLHLELQHPIPEPYLANAEYLTLTWPVGGIWKIMRLSDNNRKVHCMSWRKTQMTHTEVEELAKKVEAAGMSGDLAKSHSSTLAAAESSDLPLTRFDWKMQLGRWGHKQHWFLRDIMPPHDRDSVGSSHHGPLTAHLMAGFSPLEVEIEVNAITSVDTVAQTFTADVTWEVTMPAITTIREDSVLRELMDILEFDENEFEFKNASSMQEERDMTSELSPAGTVHFTDSTSLAMPLKSTSEFLSHLMFSRRIVAVFSEEMTLRKFPVDQQKLTFVFSTGYGVRQSLRITPVARDAGTFAIANYRLGNVFDVVYHDKVFVGKIDAEGEKKETRFEMVLERRPEYCVTNVAIPAAIITYLCFISYAPLSDGSLMDTGDRLQIVLTLLLTAVTFKSEVASLTPQISYFTTLDKYVFFCFIIACLVAIENALFPLFVGLFPSREKWQEHSWLGFSIGFFTLVNMVWAVYIIGHVKNRRRVSEALIKVHEAIRVLSASIPPQHRNEICCTEFGYLFVQLPNDGPTPTEKFDAKAALHAASRQRAEREFDTFKEIYQKLNPEVSLLYSSSSDSEKPLRAAKPNEAGGGGRDRRRSVATPSSPVRAASKMMSNRRW